MAVKKFKMDTSVAATTVTAEQIDLAFKGVNRRNQELNAYRIKSLKFQVDDYDAEADGDYLKFQLAYQMLSAFVDIADKDEVLTLLIRMADIPTVGTNAGTGLEKPTSEADKLREQGLLFIDGRDFNDIYIVKNKAWGHFLNAGQDATEVIHWFISGQYVHLEPDDIKALTQGVTLT